MEKQNRCRMRFICIQPYHVCEYYEEKKEFTESCKFDFVGECVNQDAQIKVIEERLKKEQ